MADITNTSPVVTEDKLKDFYEDIKPFLGCPAYVTQEGSSDYYSTDEKIIGRWIDGKPLYQKTFVPSTTYNAGTHNIATGITNIDKMVEIKGVQINNNTGDTFAIDENSNDYIGYIGGKIVYTKTSTGVTWKIIVSIKYTKTTDSAATTIQSDPNEYSTDEKIIGHWIDGKPIYQKIFTTTATYTFTNSWQNTSVTPEIGTANIDLIIEATLLRIKNKEVVNCTRVAVDNNNLYLQSAITFNVESGSKIILRYTKTTD